MSQPTTRAALRILALPLRRYPTPLIYYHVLTPPPVPHVSASLSSPGTADSLSSRATHWLKRSAGKAMEMWDDLGNEKHPETSWKRRVYSLGMHAMDRVPFEETALKAVDVAALKTLQSATVLEGTGAKASVQDKMEDGLEAVILHPRADSHTDAAAQWRTFVKGRIPLHRRAMWIWTGLTPIMLPLAVLPGPNLPMCFTAWRSWGHHQALNAAQFLSTLRVEAQSSSDLDAIFTTTSTSASSTDTSKVTASSLGFATESSEMDGLLTPERAAALTKLYSLPPHVHTELLRAISQAAKRAA